MNNILQGINCNMLTMTAPKIRLNSLPEENYLFLS